MIDGQNDIESMKELHDDDVQVSFIIPQYQLGVPFSYHGSFLL